MFILCNIFPEDKSLGERIREARKSKGLTQQQLADIMGVSRSTITSIELGNNKPDSFTKNLIIKSLGIEESYFYLKPKDLTQINNFNIGETITYFRKCLNLTQLELAEKSFVTKDTIFKIESNKLIPRKPTLITISQALQVEPKILLEKIELEKKARKKLDINNIININFNKNTYLKSISFNNHLYENNDEKITYISDFLSYRTLNTSTYRNIVNMNYSKTSNSLELFFTMEIQDVVLVFSILLSIDNGLFIVTKSFIKTKETQLEILGINIIPHVNNDEQIYFGNDNEYLIKSLNNQCIIFFISTKKEDITFKNFISRKKFPEILEKLKHIDLDEQIKININFEGY